MAKSTAIKKAEQQLPAVADDDFFEGTSGLEDIDQSDVSLPRWTILQGLSPQVNPRNDEHVEGAQIGMLFNTATGAIADEIDVVFAGYQRRNVEWVPRKEPNKIEGLPKPVGGGLVNDYGPDDEILSVCVRDDQNGSLWTPRGNQLVITGTWYVIDPNTLSTAFIAMGNTQFTSSKKIMAGIRDEKIRHKGVLRPAPLFYRQWKLNTRLRTHEENEWFVWNHKAGVPVKAHENGVEILHQVREIQRTLASDEIIVDMAAGEVQDAGGSDNANM